MCESKNYFTVRPSVRPPSVHLSFTLSLPKILGGIQPNLLHHFPSWLECARATLFFRAPVRLCVWHPYICPSGALLLNHLAEFNQTFYMTSPYGKFVREQHYFSVRLSMRLVSVHLSITLLLLNHLAEFNQTCYKTTNFQLNPT